MSDYVCPINLNFIQETLQYKYYFSKSLFWYQLKFLYTPFQPLSKYFKCTPPVSSSMGMCTSQQPKKPRPLIKLIKVKMDAAHQEKDIQEAIQIWNNIDGLFTQMKSTSKISNDQMQEHANNINKLLKSHPNSKFLETFFSYFDQFQSKLNEHINQHQELATIQYENIFSNLDSLNSKFTKWGYASRLGCTQSLIKYN